MEEFGALAFSPRATRGQRRAREAATALAATRAAAAVVERTAAGRATAAVRGTLESQLGEDDEEEADWRTRARERDGERAEAEKTTPPPAGILGSVFQRRGDSSVGSSAAAVAARRWTKTPKRRKLGRR